MGEGGTSGGGAGDPGGGPADAAAGLAASVLHAGQPTSLPPFLRCPVSKNKGPINEQ